MGKKHKEKSEAFMPPAKKSLGQHFLRNPRILQRIADAAALSLADTVLEVGPGEGTLTELLLQRAGTVIAVEKDDRLIPILKQKFAKELAIGKLELIRADILTLDTKRYTLNAKRWKVVANLPYYITGAFLRKFLQEVAQPPSSMTLLLQKEVAKRIVAADGRESILSLSVKAYGTPRYVDTVKAGAFSPPPKVDSAIIAIEDISKESFRMKDGHHPASRLQDDAHQVRRREKQFFELLKKGFAHPRKLLSSNLHISKQKLLECGIEEKSRAENLTLQQWRSLVTNVFLH